MTRRLAAETAAFHTVAAERCVCVGRGQRECRGPSGGAVWVGERCGTGTTPGVWRWPVCAVEGRGLSYHIAREVHEELSSVTQDEAQLLEYGVGHELLVGVVIMAQNNGKLL